MNLILDWLRIPIVNIRALKLGQGKSKHFCARSKIQFQAVEGPWGQLFPCGLLLSQPPPPPPPGRRIAAQLSTNTQQLLSRSPDQCALSNQPRTEPG